MNKEDRPIRVFALRVFRLGAQGLGRMLGELEATVSRGRPSPSTRSWRWWTGPSTAAPSRVLGRDWPSCGPWLYTPEYRPGEQKGGRRPW